MKTALHAFIIVGFLLVDWLIFHDILKSGESYTVTEFLTGLLSIPVIFLSASALLQTLKNRSKTQE